MKSFFKMQFLIQKFLIVLIVNKNQTFHPLYIQSWSSVLGKRHAWSQRDAVHATNWFDS